MRRSLLLLLLIGCSDYDLKGRSDDVEEPLDTAILDMETHASVLLVEPDGIDFGVVNLDESESAVVTLSNVGDIPLDLIAISIAPEGMPFTVGPPGLLELAPNQSTEVVVTYAPVQAGDHVSTVLVDSDATLDPDWEIPLMGTGFRTHYAVDMQLTADDSWTATLDGEPISGSNQNLWSSSDVLVFDLDPGEHVIAVYAWDVARVIAGFMGVVRVDGEPIAVTGDGNWHVTTVEPDPSWTQVGFDDSAWAIPQVCTAASAWGGRPTDLTGDGAQWVWHDANCRALGQGWYRLQFVLE